MDRDRREQAKQHQKQQMQMQRLSQQNDDSPQQPLFGVPKKVRSFEALCFLLLNLKDLESKIIGGLE
jgi:hypothetical protein